MLTDRENYLRNARFQGPERIPVNIVLSDATWDLHREAMEAVCLRHPRYFPYVAKGWRDYAHYEFTPTARKGHKHTDAWGCVWETAENGIVGTVQNAPLANWDDFERYTVPNPDVMGPEDPPHWEQVRWGIQDAKSRGALVSGYLPHGFLFMRLYYLRGFENLMVDIASGEPRLQRLIDKVVEHDRRCVDKFIQWGVEVLEFPEDLGTQTASVLSPPDFRRWLKPAYRRLMAPCKAAGILVAMHSDGHTLELLDDQIEMGVDIVNPQDLVNGIANLAKYVKGRACIRLDVDRQTILPFGTRQEIHALIEEEVRQLGDPRGGLEFIVGIYPPTPPANVDALCEAFEKFETYWWR